MQKELLLRKERRGPIVVGIGEILWDFLPGGKKLGGAPANFVFYAQILGAEAFIVSRVGKDELGKEIIHEIHSRGLRSSHITVDDFYLTGTVTVSLDEKGTPKFIILENVAWDYIEMTPEIRKLGAMADAVCFGSLAQRSNVSRKTIRDFLKITKENCLRVFDVNLRQPFFNKEILTYLLCATDILKLNEEELLILAEMLSLKGGERDILQRLIDLFSLNLIALTKGEKGSRLFSRERDSFHPGFRVDAVDTVGAGDAFTAALVMGLLQGKPLDRINEFANRLASFVCSQRGAWVELTPYLSEKWVEK